MATLNEIPLSFLKHHSYILHVSTRSDYGYNYGSSTLFPSDFQGTIGDFLDSDIKNDYLPLYTKICREKVDRGREFKIKDFIVELYDVTKSQYPFKQFRLYSFLRNELRPEIYRTNYYDTWTLEEVFNKADDDSKAVMGLSLVVNDQYRECLNLDYFKEVKEDDDFLLQVRTFISCYKRYKQSLPVRRNNDNQGEVFARMYQYKQYDSTVPTLDALAEEFSRTREGIRLKIKSLVEECRSMVIDRGLDYLLPDSFNKRISDLTAFISSRNIINRQELISKIGRVDVKTLEFIVDLYGMQEMDLGVFDSCYTTKRIAVKDIQAYVASLHDYFAKNPVGLTKSMVDRDCLKKASPDVRTVLLELIDVSTCFVREICGDETIYLIKWQFIKNISERIARILYEEKNHELQLEDIVRIYNDRSLRSNIKIDPITVNVLNQRPDLIKSIGRTGLWKLVDASPLMNNDVVGAEALLKEFLSTQERDDEFDFNEFKSYLRDRDIENYSDKSLGAIINSLGFKKKQRGKSIYVKNNIKQWSVREIIEATAHILAESSEQTYSKSDIKKILEEQYSKPVNYGTLTISLETADDLFELQPSGRSVKVILLNDRLSEVDFSRYEKVHEYPPYQKAIIQTAIDELLRSKDSSMLMSELKAIVEKYIPSDIHDNIVYKIFEREEIFKKSDTKPKIISLDQKIYNDLYVKQTSMFDENQSEVQEKIKIQPATDLEFGFDWSLLKEMIISHHRLTFDVNNYQDKHAVLDRMYDIMKGSETNLFSDNQFWKILDMWYRLYKYPTSCYERELLGTKLVLGMENYIQNLLYRYGKIVYEEGLSAKINSCQVAGYMPPRNMDHKINKIIGLLISIRNRYSHQNNERYHGDAHVYSTIDLCMRFYIMIAEYDCMSTN